MKRFTILYRDNDHVLLDSETRPGKISHSLEKIDGQWSCFCEHSQEGGNDDCKHRKYMRELEQEAIRELAPRFLTKT